MVSQFIHEYNLIRAQVLVEFPFYALEIKRLLLYNLDKG